jgi:hypothetical protein
MSEWSPSAEDIQQSQRAYMRYVGGVGILNDPTTEFSRGVLGQGIGVEVDVEPVIICAEELIYDGLSKVIRFANPQELRSAKEKMEHRFEAALPHIMSLVDSMPLDDMRAMRLDRINPAFLGMLPMPLTDEAIYHNFCHSRRDKLEVVKLLDGYHPAAQFEQALGGRTLANYRTGAQKRGVNTGPYYSQKPPQTA